MSKNFTSVVKLVGCLQPASEGNAATHPSAINTGSNVLQIQDRTVTLPATQPLPLSPLRNTQLQDIRFSFDHVFAPGDAPGAIYKQSVKEIVENCLLGYHATVVSFGTELDREQNGNGEGVLICKAAEQIFRCLKKSRRSKSKSHSSTSNLVVLCSYAVIVQEKVYDLLFGYDPSTQQSGGTEEAFHQKPRGIKGDDGSTVDIELPPELQLLNGSILGATQHKVKSGKKLAPLLKFGRETESKIIEFERLRQHQSRNDVSSPQRAMQGGYQTFPGSTHHTVFTLTVEYSQFGSMNAPVSGNLMFVDIAASDPLANRQRHTTGDQIDSEFLSLFTFADVVDSLTSNAAAIEGVGSSGSTYNINGEGTQLPCVPETASKELYQNSLLTQVLQDSLGGNCKTLLITHVPELVLPARYGELYETLKLASRARMIQNNPNKRDLAEKALMSAYMRGLQEMYGQGVLAKQEQRKPQRTRIVITSNVSPFHGETGGDDSGLENRNALSTSKASLSSDDIDTAYDEMINMTEGEKRQQNMELAATALVAAALEDREEEEGAKRTATGDDELSSGEDDSDDDSRGSSETQLKHSGRHGDSTALQTKVRLKKKKKKAPVDPRRAALLGGGPGGLESASVSSLTDRDITIDVLVNIIQDPDKGVPRPPASALKTDVKIRKDTGSIFCGAELVKWMVQNIDGVESEDDAETLGQLLLDKEALFHTEGSKVFANAESLFYYTAFSRPTKKLLSQEEVKRLLAQATSSSTGPTTTGVSAVEQGGESPTNINQGDMTIVELGDSQVSVSQEAMAVTKSKGNKTGLNCGDMSVTELDESQLSVDREATTATKLKESSSNINHEANMAVVDVDNDEGENQKHRMHFNQGDAKFDNEGHSSGDHGQQQTFAESDVQRVALDGRSTCNGKIQQEVPTDGRAESSGGVLAYDGAASGRSPHVEDEQYTTSYEVQDADDEGTTNYGDQIEQAQAELLKRQEENSGQPNTVAQEHIPSVQTLEKTTNYPHPLHMAVAIGKSSGVVRQLVMMFGVNKRDEYNRTPLMFAALGNNKSSSCSTLIDCGAEVDRQDICGLTALHVACYHGNKAAASVLLHRKASVCVFDNTDHSVYHWSTVPDDHACLQLLMSVATPDLVMYADRFGLTALHWAISFDHSDHLKLLLKMCKEPLTHDSEGRTLLTYSIQQQAMQCIKVLLPAHPSLLTHTDTNGDYPLHHAAIQKSPQFLEVLLSHKLPKKSRVSVDTNCRNGTGQTPLHCAVAYNRLQNATVLVNRGANVEAADDEEKTCLDYANALGDGDRELMLSALTGGTELSAEASGEPANLSNKSKQTSSSSRSRVCTIL